MKQYTLAWFISIYVVLTLVCYSLRNCLNVLLTFIVKLTVVVRFQFFNPHIHFTQVVTVRPGRIQMCWRCHRIGIHEEQVTDVPRLASIECQKGMEKIRIPHPAMFPRRLSLKLYIKNTKLYKYLYQNLKCPFHGSYTSLISFSASDGKQQY